MKLLNTSEL